jgi:hypothetical protein
MRFSEYTRIIGLCAGILFLSGTKVLAQRTLTGTTETQQLGMAAGAALACGAGQELDDFELIASRIIANKAPSRQREIEELKIYAEEKLRTYNLQRQSPPTDCSTVLNSFKKMSIFSSTIYADGTVKLPDGSFLKPRKK